MRIVPLLALLVVSSVAFCQDVNISGITGSAFSDLALLPTRLTAYNQHDDAATASYTCCRVRQEKQIKAAIEANEAFLNRFGDTSFADSTLIHYARVASFLPDAYRNQEWACRTLLESYSDSDLADDAAWILGNLYESAGDRESAIKVFEFSVKKWPDGCWADHCLHCLIDLYTFLDDKASALDTLNELAYKYPKSEFCAQGLSRLADSYMSSQDYDSAINASKDVIRDFPFSDLADDSQMRIANCLRLMGKKAEAMEAFADLIDKWYGSSHTNTAMREFNTLSREFRTNGRVVRQAYDPETMNPAKDAQILWDKATYLEKNGHHSSAISMFREFIDKYPGGDMMDDAWFRIGEVAIRQDQLFQNINAAKGPEDMDRLRDDYTASTDDGSIPPTDGSLSSVEIARQAFAHVANDLKGSELQCQALGMVARGFIKYGEIEDVISTDAAFTYQEIVIHFPASSSRPPWFTDGVWPTYALCRLITYYADPKNWEDAREMYPALAAEYPAVFPIGLETDGDAFYELMGLYALKTNHVYFEMERHIPYNIAPSDLVTYSRYYRAAMMMDRGQFSDAIEILRPIISMNGHPLVAPAAYLCGQAALRTGDAGAARDAFEFIIADHKNSGLADDARSLLDDPSSQPMDCDVYRGKNVIVDCPFTRAALMRQYNMPNVWDESMSIVNDWAGIPSDAPLQIIVSKGDASGRGNPCIVAGDQIKDPPMWSLGLSQISSSGISRAIPDMSKMNVIAEGIGQFVAASLQYDLVTETRDAIGSATAVKLPQQEVIDSRNAALKALEDYIIAGEDAEISPSVVAGMMYSLLDTGGYSKDRLIDREPYRLFFSELKRGGAEKERDIFTMAIRAAFGDRCTQQIKDWRLAG